MSHFAKKRAQINAGDKKYGGIFLKALHPTRSVAANDDPKRPGKNSHPTDNISPAGPARVIASKN